MYNSEPELKNLYHVKDLPFTFISISERKYVSFL